MSKPLSANSLDFTMVGGVGEVVYRSVRFSGYHYYFDGEHNVMMPEFPSPFGPVTVGTDYNLTGQQLLSSLRNLFMRLNVRGNHLNINEEVMNWCITNIHPYDIDELCEDADDLQPGTLLSTILQQTGTFFVDDFIKDLQPLVNTFEFASALASIKNEGDPQYARKLYYEGRFCDGLPFFESYQHIQDDAEFVAAVRKDMQTFVDYLLGLFPNFEMRLKVDKQTGKIAYAADVKSVFDIAWYTLGRMVADVAPPVDQDLDHMFRQGKILYCTICGNTFVRTSSRQKYCDNPDCKAEVNRRNRRNSYYRKKARATDTPKE